MTHRNRTSGAPSEPTPEPDAGKNTATNAEDAPTQADAEPNSRLSVVGIGASAGGLAALRALFSALPADSGMTFVVIMHLSPEYESNLPSLLQPYTHMPVTQVTEHVEMEPNHVYVIPPAKRLVVTAGHLDLADFAMSPGHRLQIDTFFRSLATHHSDGAAIILSGGGSDGAVGIQSIKEGGGLILVQDPAEAEFDSMPRSAIATGLVDVVAPVAELAAQLVAAKRTRAALELPSNPNDLSNAAEQLLIQILTQLRLRTGHDFSGYKRGTILRRISRRMQLVQAPTLGDYIQRLRQSDEEAELLYRDLLIHVTEFFRDREAWETLEREIIPQLFVGKGRDDHVRVWTVGCATGEEAYGLGILLLEYAATLNFPPHIQVFASDLGRLALDFAREGAYPEAIAANVSEARLARFFEQSNSHYRVRNELRDLVLFTPHNLLQDPPFSRLDLIICRNLLIYLQRPIQERVYESFHYALRPDGYLFLGSAESVDDINELFETANKRHRIYRRSKASRGTLVLPSLPLKPSIQRDLSQEAQAARHPERPRGDIGEQHRLLLEEMAPPSLLVDEHYNVLHLSETVGHFLQPAGGVFSSDVTRLVRPELEGELRTTLARAFVSGRAARSHGVPVQFNGTPHPVSILVRPGPTPGRALVFFLEEEEDLQLPPATDHDGEAGTEAAQDKRRSQLEAELTLTQQRLQSTREEYETTVEELRAANEELQSANEEYRSTLEELETSKEELQSINEELQTVNQELKSKVEETMQVNSDLQNLFAATEIATLFLDRDLHIERYTPRAAELFNLMPPDRGRPISHLRANLVYEEFTTDARQVLRTLVPLEREVQGDGDIWFQVNMRPYRTLEDRIEGVVITFVDVTANKQHELALRNAKEYAESIVHTIPDALLVLTTNLRVQTANDSFYTMFAVSPTETEGRLVYELGNNQWDIPELRTLLEEILPENKVFTGYEVTHSFEGIGRRTMLLNGRQLDHVQLILLAITDITERKRAEEAQRELQASLSLALEAANMGSWDYDLITNQARTDRRHNQLFGYAEPVDEWNPTIALEQVLPDDRPRFEAAYEKALETGELDVQMRVRWPDGTRHRLHDRGRVYYDDAGQPVRLAGVTVELGGEA
ncbi:MAG: CheR family methyltransferase [Caldilineaceae bacterium]